MLERGALRSLSRGWHGTSPARASSCSPGRVAKQSGTAVGAGGCPGPPARTRCCRDPGSA